MATGDPDSTRLERLRAWRTRGERDLSLKFLTKQFKQDVARPHKQLAALVTLWEQLLPVELAAHTRLESLSQGTLRVLVESSAHLYELDHLLRSGLQRELITSHKGPALRRVQLRVGKF